MRLRFSRLAESDLDEIADYISVDSPRTALAVVQRLRSDSAMLLETPKAYALWGGGEAQDLRRRVSGNYLIFRRADQDEVLIVRILHGQRDIPAIIGEVP